ncbi:MAG: N-acetylglucosamine-6-phosphate deacetylase [Lachnospiraceae bacterium]|nr:N-acetylglucosamine-6-phosphate deacetylase [Lachnospiraceae bacterium]
MLIKNARILFPDRIEEGAVRIEGDKITEINPREKEGEAVMDAEGMYLSPGFIDIHIHGAGGYDTMEGTREALAGIGRAIAVHGTTSYVPTTMTMDTASIRRVVKVVSEMRGEQSEGAGVIGVHLEGPFVNSSMLGAQNPEYVKNPSKEELEKMIRGYESSVITVTFAPELPGSKELITFLKSHGIHASMGHTCADYETAKQAISAGVSHVTHLYNAMTPLKHREPGVVGAVFDSDITTEFIADGIHIEYPALRIALKQKGTDRIVLVTDAMMGCTMPEGKYFLGGQEVWIQNGMAKLRDGTFAGTLLTLDEAVRNLKNNTEYPLYELVKMATWNPAVYCGIEDHKGRIAEGYDADVILFDEDIRVRKVIIGGRIISQKNHNHITILT